MTSENFIFYILNAEKTVITEILSIFAVKLWFLEKVARDGVQKKYIMVWIDVIYKRHVCLLFLKGGLTDERRSI